MPGRWHKMPRRPKMARRRPNMASRPPQTPPREPKRATRESPTVREKAHIIDERLSHSHPYGLSSAQDGPRDPMKHPCRPKRASAGTQDGL
eukprot:4086421-Pyramimonas_sp.AAC.1